MRIKSYMENTGRAYARPCPGNICPGTVPSKGKDLCRKMNCMNHYRPLKTGLCLHRRMACGIRT